MVSGRFGEVVKEKGGRIIGVHRCRIISYECIFL